MKNKKILSIPLQKLHETQKVLTAANFELDEIWTPDQGNESQIWSNSKNKSVIEIRITENIEDATREDIKNEIIQLKCPEGQQVSSCHWKVFPQKLKFARSHHVVIPLPASYELCNN